MPKSTAHASVLIRREAPFSELDALAATLVTTRGMHRVEINHKTEWNSSTGTYKSTGWRTLIFRGTNRAVTGGKNLIMMSGLQELDANADHDHARCIETARKMGVPAAWAHRPETYLSM